MSDDLTQRIAEVLSEHIEEGCTDSACNPHLDPTFYEHLAEQVQSALGAVEQFSTVYIRGDYDRLNLPDANDIDTFPTEEWARRDHALFLRENPAFDPADYITVRRHVTRWTEVDQ